MKKLKREFEELQSRYTALTQELDQYKDAKQQLSQIKEQNAQYLNKIDQLEQKQQQKSSKNKNQINQLQQLQNKVDALEEECNKLKELLEKKESKIKNQQNEIQSLQKKLGANDSPSHSQLKSETSLSQSNIQTKSQNQLVENSSLLLEYGIYSQILSELDEI
eukprot:TRINITY_DN6323_c0_g1_i1.p1 TRINITY_DN6323_c0_g1~~TRINITY_DN6323_c0_g1_i1.p1  ORF type:complete len:163 (-),score=45.66 TRINITY_DN6323_c0_g1_i1:245-733(-)